MFGLLRRARHLLKRGRLATGVAGDWREAINRRHPNISTGRLQLSWEIVYNLTNVLIGCN